MRLWRLQGGFESLRNSQIAYEAIGRLEAHKDVKRHK